MFLVDTDTFSWKLFDMSDADQLESWIAENTTVLEFARDVECSESHLRNIIAGRRRPSIYLYARIRKRTGGLIDLVREAAE